MFEGQFIDADKFIAETTKSGPTFTWVITIDPQRPDFIFYYPQVSNPQNYPCFPIHKDRIRRIEPLFQVLNYSSEHKPLPPSKPIWVANVVLNPLNDEADSELVGALLAIFILTQATPKSSDVGIGTGRSYSKASSSVAQDVVIDNKGIGTQNVVGVILRVRCPKCNFLLSDYFEVIEASNARIGENIIVNWSGACFNRGGVFNAGFDWRGVVTTAEIIRIE